MKIWITASLLAFGVGQASAAEDAKWDVNNPPAPKATVQLDTNTGTWMTVDVSPDGKQIVFDLLGDLYLLPIDGGEAKALTDSMAWEMQARFSPDGKTIAYMSDAGGGDNVWMMNVDGSNAKPVSNEDFRLLNNPFWHPNGQYIAARKHYTGTRSLGSGEIWLYHVAGGKGVQLNEKPNWQKDLGEPAISPDGKYLYYSRDTTPGSRFEYNKNAREQIFEIFRQNLETGESERFVSGAGGAVRPIPSPDGKYLAFVRRLRNQSTLYLKDLQTGREFPVWDQLERDMQEAWSVHGVYPGFDWMPDSKEIVVWAKGNIWRVNPFTSNAKIIPFQVKDTREVREAVRFAVDVAPEQFDVNMLRWVNVSPKGDKVIYSAMGHLYVKSLPNGEAKRLTKVDDRFEFFPQFSRDGKQIVFVAWDDKNLGSVRVIPANGGREKVLTKTPGKYLEPTFSPDGETVVFVKDKGGYLVSPWHALETGVFAVDAEGKTAARKIAERGSKPQFAAESDYVYLTDTGVNNEVDWYSKLVRHKLDGSEKLDVAKSEFASEFALSPDGKWLAFAERFHTFVTPMPAVGKTISIGPKMDSLPVKQLDVNAGEYLHWSGNSERVHFALGDQLFSRELKNAFSFIAGAPAELPKPSEDGVAIGFKAKASKPSSVYAITGAKIITMNGDEVIDNGIIIVQGNRITAIGKNGELDAPREAQVIDASGKTIIPGLVDAHWHGGMGEEEIIPQQSWVNYASLAFGVTTIHDPSNDTSEIFTASEMQKAGKIVGPRIYSTGTILYGAKAPFTAPISNYEEALSHLKRMQAVGAISVKSYNQPRREQRQQVLEAARHTGLMVVPEGGSLFQHNMNMIIDGHTGVEHAIPVANAYDDVVQLWSQTKVGYTPTFAVGYGGLDGEHYWYARTEVWKHPILSKYVPRTILESRAVRRETAPEEDFNIINVARTATKLARAGVRVNIGAHGQREGLAAHWEMWTMALGGATPMEALRIATINPAHYLGMDKDIGSLEVGKLADLVIINGDVLADIRNSDKVEKVMINGRLYDSATMNEIGATPKKRQPFFFEGADNLGVPVTVKAHSISHGH